MRDGGVNSIASANSIGRGNASPVCPLAAADAAGFELYTLLDTCLTCWAPHMDPWTLAYLAGHRDMNTTKRCVHPQEQTILVAMEKARAVKGGRLYLPATNCSKRAVTN